MAYCPPAILVSAGLARGRAMAASHSLPLAKSPATSEAIRAAGYH